MNKTHNPIKNKVQVNHQEMEEMRAKGIPAIRRCNDGTWWINKRIVKQHRTNKIISLVQVNTEPTKSS